jgi:hypothetical protein
MVRGLGTSVALSLLLSPLAGCAVRYSGEVPAQAVVGAAILVGIVAAQEDRYYRVGPDGMKTPVGRAPPPDPARKINVQDCSRPVDPAAGNLVCK